LKRIQPFFQKFFFPACGRRLGRYADKTIPRPNKGSRVELPALLSVALSNFVELF
jgi:hypothetical protein